MTRGLYFRLSVMMFLEYFALGATSPVLSHYLKNGLGFSAFEVGLILAMPAIAGLVAPLLTSRLADRMLSAERLLGLCHLLGAAMMAILYFVHDFRGFLALYFVWGFAFAPTLALTNAVAFHHCTNARREFGVVRGIGTGGWIAVAWLFGFLWLRGGGGGTVSDRLPHALLLTSATSLVLALYTLSLPRAKAVADKPPAGPWQALKLFTQPGLLLLCLLVFVNAVMNQYYHYGMSPFLSRIGFEDKWIMPAMGLGQIPEVAIMALLGLFLSRFGIKRVMVLGVVFQMLRFACFAIGDPLLVLAAIPAHGLSYALFFTTAFLYLDEHCAPDTRASAQLLFAVITGGVGNLVGSLLAGQTGEWFTDPSGEIHFTAFWLVPTVIGVGATLAIAIFFRERDAGTESTVDV
jgi:nucleoside transporter